VRTPKPIKAKSVEQSKMKRRGGIKNPNLAITTTALHPTGESWRTRLLPGARIPASDGMMKEGFGALRTHPQISCPLLQWVGGELPLPLKTKIPLFPPLETGTSPVDL
jgi:hypothetical protein